MARFEAFDWGIGPIGLNMDNLQGFAVFNNPVTFTFSWFPSEIRENGTLGGGLHVIVDMKSEKGHPFKFTGEGVPIGGYVGRIDVTVDGSAAWELKGISARITTVISDIKAVPYNPVKLLKDLLGKGKVAIIGSDHNDVLDGQHAHAKFVYKTAPFGHDWVDFRAGDKIEFAKSILGDFSDVKSHASVVGSDVVITVHPADTITLPTVHHIGALTASDFLFV
jgi:hypothetical protein